jgi:hypothetical protein
MKTLVTVVACAALLATAAAAEAKVRVLAVSSPVSPGNAANLVVRVSPARSCTIIVHYKSGPSKAKGLYAKRPTAGIVSWSWIVGTRTTAGRWPITVSCGSAGTLRTSFVVR